MSEIAKQGIKISVNVPANGGTGVFRIRAADEILRLLADAHETEFAIPELVDATEYSRSTVWRAVELLHEVGAVRIRETPQRKYVAIGPDRLQKDDPILAVEQSEFHEPIRTFVERVREIVSESDGVDELLGVLVFGSVARGTTDRRSDIDLFVVVDGDRTGARRLVTDVVSALRERRFDGDRFDFEPYVESVESVRRAGSKLEEIFREGITVHGDERIQSLRKEVFADE